MNNRWNMPAAFGLGIYLGVGAFSDAFAEPTGGAVQLGTGTIDTVDTTTTIDQTSNHLQVNWATFNVAADETVNFVQPSATAIALNRILDVDPSSILGSLTANGRVVLSNPNGILFGANSTVNVGALIATSLDPAFDDFDDPLDP